MNGRLVVRRVPFDGPVAAALIEAVQQEYVDRYGGRDETPVDPAEFAPPSGEFLVGCLGEQPVACGGWRRIAPGIAEIKRMYVASAYRRRGLARELLRALEASATRAGCTEVHLETGDRQPEAMALYEAEGYAPIAGFGHYRCEPSSRSYGKRLVPRSPLAVASRTFEELLAEGESVSVDGWDFSWFEGRATEERPSWGYSRLLAARMATAYAALDLQTGGGEVLAGIPQPPPVLRATESWPPNLVLARGRLAPLGAQVVEVADDAALPFPDGSFDLVVSRHPTLTVWDEIARVLAPGGSYLSQQVGSGSNRELTDFLMGPQPVSESRRPERAAAAAEAAGLVVVDLRRESLRTVFYDVGAVVHFLRKVVWTVPGFAVERYRLRLAALHEQIERDGRFVAHAQRFLIEARKPSQGD